MIEHDWEKIGSFVSKYSANIMGSSPKIWTPRTLAFPPSQFSHLNFWMNS